MKAKKGKDLVRELVDDLLGESEAYESTESTAPEIKQPVSGQSSPALTRAEASLAQSEHLRIAQQKIIDLEKEMERLREQNESLAAAGETMRQRADELLSKAENFERRYTQAKETADEEKQILLNSMKSKEQEVQQLQLKIDELETRFSSNIRKIRVRERELENRLELVKVESSAMIRTKDEIILDLKRQLDQYSHETENYRLKGQKLDAQLQKKQDVLQRTVKALRLALAMLEGSEIESEPLKKVD